MKLTKDQRKKYRVRNKVKKFSSSERFRLSVNRSTKNISAQIIDDTNNITLVSASSIDKEIKGQKKNKSELSTIVAETLAKKANEKNLELTGVGYRAALKGNILNLQLGFSHDINFNIPDGVKIQVEKQNFLKISGTDKQQVGMVAAKIKSLRPPEPYKGKGIKEQGQYILRKEGKKK